MKTTIVLLTAATIASMSFGQETVTKHDANNLEGKYACAIFPLCTDPDAYNPLIIRGDKRKDKSGTDKKDLKLA